MMTNAEMEGQKNGCDHHDVTLVKVSVNTKRAESSSASFSNGLSFNSFLHSKDSTPSPSRRIPTKLKKILHLGGGHSHSQQRQSCDSEPECSRPSSPHRSSTRHRSPVPSSRRLNKAISVSTPKISVITPAEGVPLSPSNSQRYVKRSQQIRIIKPTAIKPELCEIRVRPRPKISERIPELAGHANSAFREVRVHARSNSLSDPPRVDPMAMDQSLGSAENLYLPPCKFSNNNNNTRFEDEPIHMTLEEVRRIAFGSPRRVSPGLPERSASATPPPTTSGLQNAKTKLKTFIDNLLTKTPCIGASGEPTQQRLAEETSPEPGPSGYVAGYAESHEEVEFGPPDPKDQNHTFQPLHLHDLLPLLNFGTEGPSEEDEEEEDSRRSANGQEVGQSPFVKRALPPVPYTGNGPRSNQRLTKVQLSSLSEDERRKYLDYTSSIERVKNCGWYWGPISGEMAEKLLENESCGSFLVRDSSDEHYIFSLSFKLDGLVRHVRIEQEHGNFSFGALQKFRSTTIVDFIERAMEHSRSGRFLFFLHRRPQMGPIRVQLLHPVSRFKHVQSLRHICRFAILQYVRRDQIVQLPLPEPLKAYLDTPYYYAEELASMQSNTDDDGDVTSSETPHHHGERRGVDLHQTSSDRALMRLMLIDPVEVETRLQISLAASFPQISRTPELEAIRTVTETNATNLLDHQTDTPTESEL